MSASRRRTHAFTIVEILVVAAVLAVLAGLIAYAVHSARVKARTIACANNLKQIANGLVMYKARHLYYPIADGIGLAETLADFVDNPNCFVCHHDGGATDSYTKFYVPRDPLRTDGLLLGCALHGGGEGRMVAMFGSGRYVPATADSVIWNGQKVSPGETVTGGTLTFADGTTVKIQDGLDVNVLFCFHDSANAPYGAIRIPIEDFGEVYVNAASDTYFDVATAAATLTVRGTAFRVTTTEDPRDLITRLQVDSGTVEAEYHCVRGRPGSHAMVRAGGVGTYRLPKEMVWMGGGSVPSELTGISVSGPDEVNEKSSAHYTCTARYSDGRTRDVTTRATWSENSAHATINGNGRLSTGAVNRDRTCTVTARYGGKRDGHTVTIKDVPPTLEKIVVAGPAEVAEESTANYTCTAHYSDGTTRNVTTQAAWSENSPHATINGNGALTTGAVDREIGRASCRERV